MRHYKGENFWMVAICLNRNHQKGDTTYMELKFYSESDLEVFYGSEGAAGLDLPFYDPEHEEYTIQPGERFVAKTGIYMEIPKGYVGFIDSRSSSSKLLIDPMCRTIDADYRGNVGIVWFNDGDKPVTLKRGKFYGQMLILPVLRVVPTRVDSLEGLSQTVRGTGSFGSTGNTTAK